MGLAASESAETKPAPEAKPAAEAKESTTLEQDRKEPQAGRPRESGTHRAAAGGIEPTGPAKGGAQEERSLSPFLVCALIEPSFLFGEWGNFAGSFGLEGFGVDVRYLGFSKLRLTASIGWHSASGTSLESSSAGGVAYTGTAAKQIAMTPLLGKVGYSFELGKGASSQGSDKSASGLLGQGKYKGPAVSYVSLGLGATRVARRADFGIVTTFQDAWHFAIVPEVGVEVPVGPVYLLASARLNLLMPSDGSSLLGYANASVGVGFR
jgi:hypothetical protein